MGAKTYFLPPKTIWIRYSSHYWEASPHTEKPNWDKPQPECAVLCLVTQNPTSSNETRPTKTFSWHLREKVGSEVNDETDAVCSTNQLLQGPVRKKAKMSFAGGRLKVMSCFQTGNKWNRDGGFEERRETCGVWRRRRGTEKRLKLSPIKEPREHLCGIAVD